MIVMGAGHQPLVPLRHDLPRLPDPDQPHRLPGRQRRRLGALRRPGEGPPDHRLHPDRQRAGLDPAAAQHDPDRLLVPAHRPVPLRPLRRRHPGLRDRRQGQLAGKTTADVIAQSRADGLDAVLPDVRPQPARPRRRRRPPPGRPVGEYVVDAAQVRRAALRRRGPGRARELPPRPVDLAGQPARAPPARATSTSSSTCSAPTPRSAPPRPPRASARVDVTWRDEAPRASSTC